MTTARAPKKTTSDGVKAVKKRGIVVSSAYATGSEGGGKLPERARAELRARTKLQLERK